MNSLSELKNRIERMEQRRSGEAGGLAIVIGDQPDEDTVRRELHRSWARLGLGIVVFMNGRAKGDGAA